METNYKIDFLSHITEQLQKKNNLVSSKTLDKVEALVKVLSAPIITINKLQIQCFYGIPDEINGLRSLCWKLLLEYLPTNRSKWQVALDADRKNYEYYKGNFLKPNTKIPPADIIRKHQKYCFTEDTQKTPAMKLEENIGSNANLNKKNPNLVSSDALKTDASFGQTNIDENNQSKTTEKRITRVVVGSDVDHPLSTSKTSEWNTYFKDMTLWDEIEKDTKRTRNELDFFQKQTGKPMAFSYSKTVMKSDPETHIDVLSRILFIYGKLNPGIGYIQGMNEILAPIYYCFCLDKNSYFVDSSEADAFYCFMKLMEGGVKDSFMGNLEQANHGIQIRIKCLNELLKKVDKVVWAHLEKYAVNPQFYSLRWLLLLLTQEFELSDVLILWDALLSHPKRIDFLYYICLSMILGVRDLIMVEDFSIIMETLQKNSTSDLEKILNTSVRLYKQFAKPEEMSFIVFQ